MDTAVSQKENNGGGTPKRRKTTAPPDVQRIPQPHGGALMPGGTRGNAGGGRPITHGRYGTIKRESLRALIEQHEADPDPLNILPELAATRALFQDYIERYDEWRDALTAWHASFKDVARPLPEVQVARLEAVLDEYESVLDGEPTETQETELRWARGFVGSLRQREDDGKPLRVLDLADAYRIASEVTKIVERIERIRSANAISRPDLMRVLTEMGRVVAHYVTDETVRESISRDWLSIRVA